MCLFLTVVLPICAQGPGTPALNSRPVALGAYNDIFWAGPATGAGHTSRINEAKARRQLLANAGRKVRLASFSSIWCERIISEVLDCVFAYAQVWSDMNRPPLVSEAADRRRKQIARKKAEAAQVTSYPCILCAQ